MLRTPLALVVRQEAEDRSGSARTFSSVAPDLVLDNSLDEAPHGSERPQDEDH